MSLEKKIEKRNKGLRTVNSATAALLVGSVAATGAVTAGLASASIVGSGEEQLVSQDTSTSPTPAPPVNAPQAANANAADMLVVKAKKKAAKKAAAKAAAQAAAQAAAAAAAQQAAQQQQSQQKPAKSHGS